MSHPFLHLDRTVLTGFTNAFGTHFQAIENPSWIPLDDSISLKASDQERVVNPLSLYGERGASQASSPHTLAYPPERGVVHSTRTSTFSDAYLPNGPNPHSIYFPEAQSAFPSQYSYHPSSSSWHGFIGNAGTPSLHGSPCVDFNADSSSGQTQGMHHPPAFISEGFSPVPHGSQPFAPTEPKGPTSVFECRVLHCGRIVKVQIDELIHHLQYEHGIQKGTVAECPWTGCTCSSRAARRGRTCPSYQHPAHVQDLAAHIWERHLNFRFVCRKCERANWTDHSSLVRHEDKCPGQTPARCGQCYTAFLTELDLIMHVRRAECKRR